MREDEKEEIFAVSSYGLGFHVEATVGLDHVSYQTAEVLLHVLFAQILQVGLDNRAEQIQSVGFGGLALRDLGKIAGEIEFEGREQFESDVEFLVKLVVEDDSLFVAEDFRRDFEG